MTFMTVSGYFTDMTQRNKVILSTWLYKYFICIFYGGSSGGGDDGGSSGNGSGVFERFYVRLDMHRA